MTKSDLICYKNYYGSVHFDPQEELFFGKIEFIRDLVNYEASEAKSLVKAFHEAVDSYLEDCVYPTLPDNMINYFDDEAWKRDAKFDGRGHSLSSYDGNEYEENVKGETFYIYRTN